MRGRLPEGRTETRLCNYCSIGVDAKAFVLTLSLALTKAKAYP